MITRWFDQNIRTYGEPQPDAGFVEEEIQIDMLNWIKSARNAELVASDKFMTEDFPIDAAEKAEWKIYRDNLRSLFDTPRTFLRNEDGMMVVDFWPSHPSVNSQEDADPRNLQKLETFDPVNRSVENTPPDIDQVFSTGLSKLENPDFVE